MSLQNIIYRSYRGRVYTGQKPNQQCQSTEGLKARRMRTGWSLGSGVIFTGDHTSTGNKILCCDRHPFWSHKMKMPECENERSVRFVYKKKFGHPGQWPFGLSYPVVAPPLLGVWALPAGSGAESQPQMHFGTLQALKTCLVPTSSFTYSLLPHFNCKNRPMRLHCTKSFRTARFLCKTAHWKVLLAGRCVVSVYTWCCVTYFVMGFIDRNHKSYLADINYRYTSGRLEQSSWFLTPV